MSPIEKIKEAFLRKDWSIIQEAYSSLTGQELEELVVNKAEKSIIAALDVDNVPQPPAKKGRPKKVKIGPTGGGSPSILKSKQGKTEDFTMPKKQNNVGSGQKVILNGKEYQKMTVQQIDTNRIQNTFVDNANMASADRKLDKKLKSLVRSERNRSEYNKVSASCVSCGRVSEVEPFEKKHYRCQSCMPKLSG